MSGVLLGNGFGEGPQEITADGRPAAVVASKAGDDRWTGTRPGLVEFLRRSPPKGAQRPIACDASWTRKIRA